jgi:uncharacterized SAM-binding protein YcdF (DUF218 family)
MFFILSKLLTFLLQPVTWLFVLLAYAVLCPKPVRKRKVLLIFFTALYIFCNGFLANEFMHVWEIKPVAEDEMEVYDAGIVLSGMMTYDIKLKKFQFMHGVDRLLQAVELYKKGKIRKIVFTGGSGSLTYSYIKEGMLIKNYLLRIGIPPSDLFIETESNNTHENAVFTKPILDKEFPHGKFLLITSAYHMRRSVACFEKAGIRVTPYSTDMQSGERKFIFDTMFIPNIAAMEVWQCAIHEMVGFLIYKLAGYA